MPKTAIAPVLGSVLLAFSVASPSAADPVTDQIEAALRSYRDGESRIAIQALQFAAAQIEEQLAEQRAVLLPEPLPGWSADPARSNAGGWIGLLTGTNVSRGYRNDSQDAEISITVTADSPLLAMMSLLMSSPMLIQAEPNTKPFSYGAYRGLTKQESNGSIQISLMLGTRILLQIQGTAGATLGMLQAYLDAIDLKTLEKALLG